MLTPLRRGPARALADGDFSGVTAGSGWPTDATLITAGRAAADPGALTWLISRDGLVIGECGIKHALGADGTAEIGYGLAAPWRADGYGSEAIGALLKRLDDLTGCRRVVAEVHETNIASRRLLERLGFSIEHLATPYLWYTRVVG